MLPGTEQRIGPRREIHGRRDADLNGHGEDDVATDHQARLIDSHERSSRDRDEHLQREIEQMKATQIATVKQITEWKVYAGVAGVIGGALVSGAIWVAVRLMVP